MNNQTIDAIGNASIQIQEMGAQLNRDIGRAVIACIQAQDDKLLRQLIGTVPEHEFTPCLKQLYAELGQNNDQHAASAAAVSADPEQTLRDDIVKFVSDVTSAHTFDLALESDERLTAFHLALRQVPDAFLGDLLASIEEHLKESEVEGSYGGISDDSWQHLEDIKAAISRFDAKEKTASQVTRIYLIEPQRDEQRSVSETWFVGCSLDQAENFALLYGSDEEGFDLVDDFPTLADALKAAAAEGELRPRIALTC